VAVVFRQQRLLVIRRSEHVVAPRSLCFPGGAIEAGESETQALVREFREELNAEIEPLCRLWQSTTPWGVELAWWQGVVADVEALNANPAEVESFDWLTPQQMLQHEMLLESNRQFLAAVASGHITLVEQER
jgi:8-oxo-dGTP pyrophosphatase MutT (NUDIX family)